MDMGGITPLASYLLANIRWYHTQGAGILECMTEDRDARFAEASAHVTAIMDRWTEGLLICRSCRNWNHWHVPDGPCLDARCECPRRPSE